MSVAIVKYWSKVMKYPAFKMKCSSNFEHENIERFKILAVSSNKETGPLVDD